MKKLFRKIIICGAALGVGFAPPSSSAAAEQGYYMENHRNQFHFSPEASWMNDPNGMVYYEGEYHLFYQNNPFDTRWGPMHWGHAVSKDLVHWEHYPIALSPDENGAIFSGSAVIDYNNTAGFGKEAMVAIFTHEGNKQVQSLAYSNDRGRTWKKYEGNPVMPDPPIRDWRDPKVFWHEESGKWVMALAAKNSVMIYSSPDLKKWTYESTFGPDEGSVQATSLGQRTLALSPQTGSDFEYKGTISVREKNTRVGAGGLLFRFDAEGKNGYTAEADLRNGQLLLKRINDGKEEVLKQVRLSDSLMKADAIELKVRAEKENIRVYADGVLLLEASDPSFENGYFGLVNDSALSVFRDVSFKNQSNFQTNLTRWQEVSGAWKKTLFGMKPKNKGTNVYLSSASESQFSYSAKLAFNTKGIGGLLFRADEAGKNGYLAELDGGRRIIKLIRIEGGKQQVLGIKAISVQNGTADLNVEADGAELSVMVNGEKVLAHRDSRFTAGALGIVSQGENMTFQNVRKQSFVGEVPEYIENPDFEKGTLEGWTPLEGTAFTDKQVSPADTYWGGPFDHQGRYHLWGAAETGDDPTGSVRSSYFKLSGSGEINFLIGGGNDRENLHVSLVRASDNRELIRSHNYRFNDDEKYRRVVWDASSYLGEKVYIKITDRKSGGWGHINADDFHVYNEGPVPEKPENDPNAGPGPLYEQKSSGALTVWNPLGGEWTTATEGSYGGIWECPELIQIPVEGEPGKKKWVMMVSINDGAPAGGSGMQYFTGDFDGKTFTNDHPPEKILWADYGADFYAAVTWNNTPGEKPIWLGWMSNWQYANDTPTSPWKSSMTVPRELVMSKESDGYRLKQAPVAQLQNLRENKVEYINKEIAPGENLLENVTGDTAEIETEFAAAGAEEAGIKVRTGGGQYTKIGYNPEKQTVFIDRTHSGFDFGPNVRKVHEAPVKAENEKIKLKILLDRSSIEVFVNDGEKVLTDQLFANPESQGMEFYTVNGKAQIDYLRVFDVKGIWGESPFRTNLTDFKPLDGQWGDTIAGKLGRSSADSFNISGTKAKDFTYSAKIRVLNEGAGALVFRADRSANNGYFVNIDTKHNVMKLMKRSNGSIQILKEEPHPFESNKEYEVKVTARGDEIQAFVNGSAIIKAFDSEFAEGYAGLNVWNATAVFQDVRLEQ